MLWNKCLDTLRVEIPDSLFSLWILPLVLKSEDLEKGVIELLAPNAHFCKQINDNYLTTIESLATKYHGAKVKVNVAVDNQVTANPKGQGDAEKKLKPKANKNKLNALFTFENFVVGNSNLMAYQTAKLIKNSLGNHEHNPLFLYGPTGLGKTHLMQALGHEVQNQNKKVLYLTSEQFVNQYVSSARTKKLDEFKKRFNDIDLFMVDDIHILAGKDKTADNFLTLFNQLVGDNKQIVLTSDKYPKALEGIDERLKSRFAWGLSVELEAPDLETRINILKKKAGSFGVVLPDDCATFIARQVVANVRELEGALNKVLATARFKDEPVSLYLAQTALKDIIKIRAEAISVGNIQKVVADYFSLSVKDLLGKKRTRAIARPRQIAMTITREVTKHSYPEIGSAFGGRDHSTVMHAVSTVQKLRDSDPMFDKDYQSILALMQA